jgi:hypothetical protein
MAKGLREDLSLVPFTMESTTGEIALVAPSKRLLKEELVPELPPQEESKISKPTAVIVFNERMVLGQNAVEVKKF